jgi:hypothetical protein
LRLACRSGEAVEQEGFALGTCLDVGEVGGGAAGAAEIAALLFAADVDAGVVVAPLGVAVETGGRVDAGAAGTAESGVDEELGEGADAELALGLLGQGELRPWLGVGERGKKADYGIPQSGGSELGTLGRQGGDVGALAGSVIGDAGLFGEGGHLDVPALLELVVEVAQLQGGLLVGDVEVAHRGDVGAPLGALFGSDTIGIRGKVVN